MQEAEETKSDLSIPDLPAEDFLKKAQDHMEALQITEAQQVLEAALIKFPNHVGILDSLGELLFSLGEVERAIAV